jgi:Raf kinase inhibitor-like YbhB/YbcL family protein
MKLSSPAVQDQQFVPDIYAAGVPHPTQHATFGANRNPPLAWSELPAGTRSLALLCVDADVPSRPDDVNQEGKTVPAELPRVEFYHWVLVDLAPDGGAIAEGEFSDGFQPKGKPGPQGPRGTRQGVNNYREWFGADPQMGGDYFGYDGPFPPWNDARMHHYTFTLYALDLARCPVEGAFTGQQVRDAIAGHVLGAASLTVRYALNPALRP